MSNIYHLPLIRQLRTMARNTGLLKYIKPILASRQKSYEECFHEALVSAVREGDVVWDVGANVGVYTKLFLDWAGASGQVVAFDPFPKAIRAVENAVQEHPFRTHLTLVEAALASEPGTSTFAGELDGESVTTTGHLVETPQDGSPSITVEMTTADTVVASERCPQPTVVKIDVEGFEEDVLLGGQKVFANPACREVLIEMHFTRMDERGLGDSASRIVSMLKSWNYKVNWVDPSHIHAKRV